MALSVRSSWANSRVRVVADERVMRGGCKVESEVGLIDASVDTQFEQVSRELLGGDEFAVDAEHASIAADRLS